MTERWRWAPYSRVKEAAEELKGIIRTRYPEATFKLVRAEDQRRSWHLLAMVDVDDPEDVTNLTIDRQIDMLSEEHIPIHVIQRSGRESLKRHLLDQVRRTG